MGAEWLGVFIGTKVRLSMDGRGRAIDNVFIEWLWLMVKHEEVYLRDYVSLVDAHAHPDRFFKFYNHRRPHSAHDGSTPAEV